ncbi:MAG: hypothetical protein ACPHOK_05720, partial [Akkermansiaceae bacterium]
TRNISPANLHDRGAGYGIIHMNKANRRITFETWPLHADPEFPSTGSQFKDWPLTISQTDNDGRIPTGYLPVISTNYNPPPVLKVYDETTDELIYAIRTRDNLVRPPIYDSANTYRIELSDGQILTKQIPVTLPNASINSFDALIPRITLGQSSLLRWDINSSESITLNNDNVRPFTVDGIGFMEVSPTETTTYTLAVNGTILKTIEIQVLQAPPIIDHTAATNNNQAAFSSAYPAGARAEHFMIVKSTDLINWTPLPAASFSRQTNGTTITAKLTSFLTPDPTVFYRAEWRIGTSR